MLQVHTCILLDLLNIFNTLCMHRKYTDQSIKVEKTSISQITFNMTVQLSKCTT